MLHDTNTQNIGNRGAAQRAEAIEQPRSMDMSYFRRRRAFKFVQKS
jgi:hypothetical protein